MSITENFAQQVTKPAVVTPDERELIFESLLQGGFRNAQPVDIEMAPGQVSRIYFRPLSAAEVFGFAAPGLADAEDSSKKPFKMVARALSDSKGNRVLPEGSEDRIYELPLTVLTKMVVALLKTLGIVSTTEEVRALIEDKTEGGGEGSAEAKGEEATSILPLDVA